MPVPKSVKVDLVGGTKLISGDTSWNGPAAKNEEKTINLTVQAPKTGRGSIKAIATIPLTNGPHFSAGAEYVLGGEVKSKSEQDHPVRRDSNGRPVIEYRQ